MTDPLLPDNDDWINQQYAPPTLSKTGHERTRAYVPDVLIERLADLRLLRGVPLHYLVPKEELLPPESLRFFYVDPTWTDRLIDGFLAAGNLGTKDQALRLNHMHDLRQRIDEQLELRAGIPMATGNIWSSVTLSGFLLRSQAVRRWPGMLVRGYQGVAGSEQKLVMMRRARLAPSVLLALFAGVPSRVDFEEPHEGVRFGVENGPTEGSYTLQVRDEETGKVTAATNPVTMSAARVIDVSALIKKLGTSPTPGSARLSWQLQQDPYLQICAVDVRANEHEAGPQAMATKATEEVPIYEAAYAKLEEA